MADRVVNGQQITLPARIGLLRIKKAEMNSGGVVCLWTDIDPAGCAGFVKTTLAEAESQFNLWTMIEMDDNWQFIEED